jgi:diguanylate cyclase (GGDEF)-like protein
MRALPEGLHAALPRLAELLAEAFCATGALVEVDGASAASGNVERLTIEEPIVRQGNRVGRVALGPHRVHPYTASEAQRLIDYARLIDAVAQQAREREQWRELAWTDDLSGLRNRRFFDKSLGELVAGAAERRLRLTLLIFDSDGFKSYNDRYGHDAGDGLIREMAELLRRSTREADVVARYGGDEFAVIFWDAEKPRVSGSQHPSAPIELAERFCAYIRTHEFKCLGQRAPGPVTISGGLASFPWDGKTPQELVAAADRALLAAKQTGKNRIVLAGDCGAQPVIPSE